MEYQKELEIALMSMDWNCIPKENYESMIDVCERFRIIVPWNYISYQRNLPESLIIKYFAKLDLYGLICKSKIPFYLIEENKDKIFKRKFDILICRYQVLTEDFMCENQDILSWVHIAHFQKLSLDFIKKFISKLPYKEIVQNKKIPIHYRERVKEIYNQYGDLL